MFADCGEYLLSGGDRTGPYREFVQVLFPGDIGIFRDLTTGDVPAKFLVLMQTLAMRWGDEFRGEIIRAREK